MNNTVAEKLNSIRATLPSWVTLVAVSKFQCNEKILEAYEAGQRVFGESRVQELVVKAAALPPDIRWHFIGHLQTNKVRQLLSVGNLALIESVDSVRLLKIIDAEAERVGVVVNILLEVHVAQEDTKYGFTPGELIDWILTGDYHTLKSTRILGIMGMASNTDDDEQIAGDFDRLAQCFHRAQRVSGLPAFCKLSMGMSGDYLLAIEKGADIVRIGSAIFGDRYICN